MGIFKPFTFVLWIDYLWFFWGHLFCLFILALFSFNVYRSIQKTTQSLDLAFEVVVGSVSFIPEQAWQFLIQQFIWSMVTFLQFDVKRQIQKSRDSMIKLMSPVIFSHVSKIIFQLKSLCWDSDANVQLHTGHFHLGGGTLNLTCRTYSSAHLSQSPFLLPPPMYVILVSGLNIHLVIPARRRGVILNSLHSVCHPVLSIQFTESLEPVHLFYLHFPQSLCTS